ncbi:MAG: PIN domain-containing protein [Chloroflexota bacterium]|nr:PIN domain-containing protein [Chloroflexota bacterium]
MNQLRLLLRMVGLAVGVLFGIIAGSLMTIGSTGSERSNGLLLIALTVGGIGYILGPHIKWDGFRAMKTRVAEASIRDIIAVAVGLAFGTLVAAPMAFIVSLLPDPAGTAAVIAVAIATIGSAVSVAILRSDDLLDPWFKPKNAKSGGGRAIIIDTNIAIDGRILDIIGTGFLPNQLLIPRFVLSELQHIADSDDPQRRARGRRGLEVLNTLRTDHGNRVEVIDSQVAEERDVDAKLTRLAKDRNASLLTNDFNLSKVAQMHGVQVLNLNLLSNALRPIVNPGERITLKVVQEGREAGQGVGFLDDGTMVVVDGGKSLVGSETPVTVTRLLQTGAGRMVFATPQKASA